MAPISREALLHYAKIGLQVCLDQVESEMSEMRANPPPAAPMREHNDTDGRPKRKWTAAQKAEVSKRMKARWAAKKKMTRGHTRA